MNRNKVRLSLPVHPKTGVPLRPLGMTRSGRPIWPILGGSGEDDGSGGAPSDDDAGKKKDPEGTDSEGGSGSGKEDDDRDPQRKIKALEDEKDRHYTKRREAEQRADDLQRQIDELKAANDKRPDVEKLEERATQAEAKVADLSEKLQQALLQNAFLLDNTYEWHNPARALQVADLSDVEIDEKGKVHGLSKALEALAKSDPYLLKPKKEDDSKKEEPKPSTGSPVNGDKRKDKGSPDREKLLQKYPGLRR